MPPQKRQLAAIMFTDIVGYTALMGKDSAKALELLRISKEIQKPLVEKHNGKWLKEMGDGILAQFNSALDAVNCAIEIQKSARAELDAKLRIGIHSGDVTVKDNDVYGDGVNVASRLESIADPGGIYVSDAIEKAIRGQSNVQAKYLGEIKLKNVDYDVRTYALQGVGLPVPDLKEDKNLSGRFMAELQRRGVLRAGATYIVLSLLLILFLPYIKSMIDLPAWSSTMLYTILIAGFPVAMYLAWNFERSPEGFVKTTSKESWQNPYKNYQKKPLTSTIIIVIMGIIIVIIYFQSIYLDKVSNKTGDRLGTEILEKSIAVLPFQDYSPGKDNEYFCNGTVEAILTNLQKIGDLKVKSRTSAEQYRNPDKDLTVIASELNVAYIVEGSVQKVGDNIRITAQLINGNTGDHLWAENYDGLYTKELLAFQSDVAKKIASSLQAVITPQEQEQIDYKTTDNMEAYDLQMRGEEMLRKFRYTRDTLFATIAINLFNQSLELDPEYELAFVSIGTVYIEKGSTDTAMYYAERMIELFPDFWGGYHMKGYIYMLMNQLDNAYGYIKKAYSMNPNGPWINLLLGQYFIHKENDVIKALPYYQRAFDLGGGEQAPEISTNLGYIYWKMGYYEMAEKYFKNALQLRPECTFLDRIIKIYTFQGEYDQAIHFLDSICSITSCEQRCNEGRFYIHTVSKEFDQAEKYYDQFLKVGGEPDVQDSIYLACIYKGQNKEQKASEVLNRIQASEIFEIFNMVGNSDDSELLQDLNFFDVAWISIIKAITAEREESLRYLSEVFDIYKWYAWADFVLNTPFYDNFREDPEFNAIVKKAQDAKAALRAQLKEMQERGEIDL